MDTIKYVFATKKPELSRLVVKYGLKPATSANDLWQKTNFLAVKYRERFMKDIADIHPDKELFTWRFSLDEPKPTEKELSDIIENTTVAETLDKKSNACGCSGADGEKKSGCCGSGADGEKTSGCTGCEAMKLNSGFTGAEITAKVKDNLPLVVVSSLALVFGIMLISKRN